MYISGVRLTEFRAVSRTDIDVVHPEGVRSASLELANINVLLGSNGGGKSTILKGIVAATLGPIAGLTAAAANWPRRGADGECSARVTLELHPIDSDPGATIVGGLTGETVQRGVRIAHGTGATDWLSASTGPDLDDTGPAFFLAAYGPDRRVTEDASRRKRYLTWLFPRDQMQRDRDSDRDEGSQQGNVLKNHGSIIVSCVLTHASHFVLMMTMRAKRVQAGQDYDHHQDH